jgi:hypothetical protein
LKIKKDGIYLSKYLIHSPMKKTTLVVCGVFAMSALSAQNATDNSVTVIYPTEFHVTKPLSEIAYVDEEAVVESEFEESKDRNYRTPQVFKYTAKDGPEYGNDPNCMQKTMGTRAPMAPLTNWAGQSGSGYPPDPSGAVGPNHYVQAVNATPLRVYNKTTGAIMLTTSIGAIFGTGNDGDPIIMYDKYADRWFISQFGISGNKIYIAVSQTPDPTGAWYTWTYTSPQFPDYLKFSIWENGYYMTSNQSTDKIFAFERDAMLVGTSTARSISKNFVTGTVSGFFVPLPADADGGLPPAGTPLPFFSYYENSWGGGVDAVKIWSMTVTWGTTPAASVTTATVLPTATFDGTYDPSWNDISQPGTTQKLDGIGGVVTYRAQWRKWTGYNTTVLNWGVKISATQRSIRWAELRQDQVTGTWSIFQEGTYTPDASSRWVGSIAMDDNGSIALCYAKSDGTSVKPSLGYTGRLATDAPGVMSFAETIAIAGTSVQTGGINRFGDYSQTTMDPSDGLTFWHTGEYLAGGSPKTRIYSFKLPLTVGVEENANEPSITAYQNGSLLYVNGTKLGSDDETVVDLFDISGRQIDGKKVMPAANSLQTSFDVSNLSSGTYLVRVGRMYTSFQRVIKVVVTK